MKLGEGASDAPTVLFFVHVPKCAGSSFRAVIRGWYGDDALFIETHDPAALAEAFHDRPRPPKAIAGHMPFGLHGALP